MFGNVWCSQSHFTPKYFFPDSNLTFPVNLNVMCFSHSILRVVSNEGINKGRDLSQDGHLEAETCRRHIVKLQMIVECYWQCHCCIGCCIISLQHLIWSALHLCICMYFHNTHQPTVCQIRPRLLPSTFLSIRCSLFILLYICTSGPSRITVVQCIWRQKQVKLIHTAVSISGSCYMFLYIIFGTIAVVCMWCAKDIATVNTQRVY